MTYPRCAYCGRSAPTLAVTRLGNCCAGPKGCAAFVTACHDAEQIPPEHRQDALDQFRHFAMRQELQHRGPVCVSDPFTGPRGRAVGSIKNGGAY